MSASTSVPRFALPRGQQGLLDRPRLIDRLDQLAALTVLHAPPGFGKSTLASVWGRRRLERGDSVIWRTARDDHASWNQLADEIERRTDQRVIVILDDGDHLADPGLADALVRFLERVPLAHVVVCTRSAVELGQIASRYQLDVERISARDLAFTAEELDELATQERWPGSLEEVLGLCGGWPELSRRVLAESSTGTIRATTAESYLRSVVLPHLAEHGMLDAALALSLARNVMPQHLAALHGRTSRSVSAIRPGDRLRLDGILMEAPGSTVAWAFVPLLRDVLMEGATTHLGDVVNRHHRMFADALYDANGDLGDVLDHARAGNHWGLLSRLWARHSLTLLAHHLPATRRAFASLPRQGTEQRPVLALAAATLGATHGGRPETARIPLDAIRRHGGGAADIDEYVTSMSSVMASQRLDGDLLGAVETGETVASELSRRVAGGTHAHPSRVAQLWLERSMTSLLVGDWGEAVTTCMRAYDAARIPDGGIVAAQAAGYLAILHHVVGSPEEGERWLEIARGIDRDGHPFESVADLPTQIVDAYAATNRLEAEPARDMITDGFALTAELWPFAALAATAYSHLFEDPRVALSRLQHLRLVHRDLLEQDGTAARMLDRCLVDTLLVLGEVNRAERMMGDIAARYDRGSGAALGTTPADLPWLRTSYAQLLLIIGDNARAQRVSTAVRAGDVGIRDRLDAMMIQAVSSRRLGDRHRAIDVFHQIGALATRFEVFHAYVVVPESELRALAEESGIGLPDVAEAHLTSRGTVFPDRNQYVELTPRELHVLHEMRHRATVAELSQTLHLSVNTVKKHLAAINSKLGVHDRRAALLEAERLGLLDPELI